MNGIRLLPVLVFGLISLFTIKVLGVLLDDPTTRGSTIGVANPGERFARAIEKARMIPHDDSLITGAVSKKDDKKEEAKKEAEKAEEAKKEAEGLGPKPKLKSEPEGTKVSVPNSPADKPAAQSAAERELLEKLKERRTAIEARDRDIEMRDTLLRTTERKLDEKIGQLRTLESTLVGPDGKSNDPKTRYKSLVVMYENMKPKEAARVFDRLDVRVLIDLVGHMNPRKVSEILAVMEPAAAERLTVAMARIAANAPAPQEASAPGEGELQRLPLGNPAQPGRVQPQARPEEGAVRWR